MITFTFSGIKPNGTSTTLTGTLLSDDLGLYNHGATMEELIGGERIVKIMNAFQPKKDWSCRVDIASSTYLAERSLVEKWTSSANAIGTVTLTPKSGSIVFTNQYISGITVSRTGVSTHEITLQMRTL